MCLGIPGQVVGMLEGYGDQLALVNVAGENRKVNIGMLPEETFDAGDWVIIHMGFVVEKTDKAGADAAMAGLEMMGRGPGRTRGRRHDRQAQAPCLRARRRSGRGVPAVRLHARGGTRPVRIRAQRQLRRRHRGGGRRRPDRRVPRPAARPTAAAGRHRIDGDSETSRWSAAPASPSRTHHDRPAAARWPPPTSPCAPNAPPNSAIRPTGATGTRSSTAPTAARGSPSSPRCPTTARRRPWRPSRCAPTAPANTTTRPTADSTPSPCAARDCGPTLRYRDRDGRVDRVRGCAAQARRLLRDGGILAVKGIGGYHLACDAANERAVAELRARKRRGDKPFAVMVADLATARTIAEIDDGSARLLSGPQRPIVLMPRSERRRGRRCGGPAQSRPRRHAGLHAAARAALRAARRRARPDRTRDDIGQPRRRADLLRRRRCTGTAFAAGRRLADARPARSWCPCDDSVVRCGRRRRTARSGARADTRHCRSRCRWPLPPTLAVGADLKNTTGRRRRKVRLAEPAHRRHGRPRDAVGVRLRAAAPAGTDRGGPGGACRRRASAVPVDRVGAPQCRGPARPDGSAPPRPHRRGDGRTRPGRLAAGARIRLRRNRLRTRQRGVGR